MVMRSRASLPPPEPHRRWCHLAAFFFFVFALFVSSGHAGPAAPADRTPAPAPGPHGASRPPAARRCVLRRRHLDSPALPARCVRNVRAQRARRLRGPRDAGGNVATPAPERALHHNSQPVRVLCHINIYNFYIGVATRVPTVLVMAVFVCVCVWGGADIPVQPCMF